MFLFYLKKMFTMTVLHCIVPLLILRKKEQQSQQNDSEQTRSFFLSRLKLCVFEDRPPRGPLTQVSLKKVQAPITHWLLLCVQRPMPSLSRQAVGPGRALTGGWLTCVCIDVGAVTVHDMSFQMRGSGSGFTCGVQTDRRRL